jgi:hypothetical protein
MVKFLIPKPLALVGKDALIHTSSLRWMLHIDSNKDGCKLSIVYQVLENGNKVLYEEHAAPLAERTQSGVGTENLRNVKEKAVQPLLP